MKLKFNIPDKLKFWQRKKVWKKETLQINPNLYWRYLLALVALVVAGSFIFGIYIYIQIKKEPLSVQSSSEEGQRTGQRDMILEKLQYFEARKIRSDEILKNPSPVVDPSV